MDEFPEMLSVKNRSSFSELIYRVLLCELRKEVAEHVISLHTEKDETVYFSFSDKYSKHKKFQQMIEIIRKDLLTIGWKSTLAYGNTALFIYEKTPPANCISGDVF